MARQWFFDGYDKNGEIKWALEDFGDFCADFTGNPFYEVGAYFRGFPRYYRELIEELKAEFPSLTQSG